MMIGKEASHSRRSLLFLAFACTVLFASLLAGFSGAAEAKVPIYAFNSSFSTPQAGGHPDLVFQAEMGNAVIEPPVPCHCNKINKIIVNTPPGLVGTPANTPQCTLVEFATFSCPEDSQIGISAVRLIGPGGQYWMQAVYNMVPRRGDLALQGQYLALLPFPSIFTGITVRTESDYGLEFVTTGILDLAALNELTVINWGVPAASSHDQLRFDTTIAGPLKGLAATRGCLYGSYHPVPLLLAGEDVSEEECPREPSLSQVEDPREANLPGPRPAKVPPAPFIVSPTTCGGPLPAKLETLAYDLESDFAETQFPAMTGCDQLGFNPSLSAKPTTTETDAPSGLDVDLRVPQPLSATAPSSSSLRANTITLPPGFTVNSSAADGKGACTDAEARFHSREAAECPEDAKIGTLSIESASLPGVLPGSIYLRQSAPGNRYRVLLVADGFSLHLKLPGTVAPNPNTGQVTMRFEDLPPLPFEDFSLHVFGAERGVLSTPSQCGTYPVKSTFVPWDDALPPQSSTQFFTIDSGPDGAPCPGPARPFGPALTAGVVNGTAGVHSPFVVQLSRRDGDQNLAGLTVKAPPGLSATLKGIPYCPDSAIAKLQTPGYEGLTEQAASACPAASQIGTVTAGAGAGTHPVYLSGKAYLGGPYKGEPLSLVAVVPAVSGPYDLGTVAVRAAIHVDPATARITTISDPLPQILEGIPLRTRFLRVSLDRPNFALNPTNCNPFAVEAAVFGDQGAQANLSAPFQVANCASLPYAPKLSLKLIGGTNRRGHPAVHTVLTTKPGEANTRSVSVSLPKGELLDQAHIGNVCTRVQFAADACPAASVLGKAEAVSPLLDAPLKGNVYLRSSSRELPDLVMDLRGQIDIELEGHVDTIKGGSLRTTFETVPDAPVTRFVLNLAGGAKGLLQNEHGLCGSTKKATVKMKGQNGVSLSTQTKLQTSCGSKARHKHKRRGSHLAKGAR